MIRDHYLWKIRPYYRQVRGLLVLGFVSGIIMPHNPLSAVLTAACVQLDAANAQHRSTGVSVRRRDRV